MLQGFDDPQPGDLHERRDESNPNVSPHDFQRDILRQSCEGSGCTEIVGITDPHSGDLIEPHEPAVHLPLNPKTDINKNSFLLYMATPTKMSAYKCTNYKPEVLLQTQSFKSCKKLNDELIDV